jgi:hypothetical protein
MIATKYILFERKTGDLSTAKANGSYKQQRMFSNVQEQNQEVVVLVNQ